MEERTKILCGDCHVEAKGRENPDGNDRVSCPVCGKEDTLDEAIGEVAKHQAFKRISDMLGGAFAGSRHVTVKSGPEPHFRWIGAPAPEN